MRVLDTFDVPGRGLVVSTDEVIEFPSGSRRIATVSSPDGARIQVEIRPSVSHNPDYLLMNVGKQDVPIGSTIDVA